MANIQQQTTLFDTPNREGDFSVIAGLSYIPDFIDAESESSLLRIVDAQAWITELKRRVQHYGYRYDYKARAVTPDSYLGPLPEWLMAYCDQLHADGYFPQLPDQVIVNEYLPGQGISPHIDCVPCFSGTIASLSLGSPCVMEFTHTETREKIAVLLEPRSLVVLSGDARYRWQHCIAGRKTDHYQNAVLRRDRRVSLTFRKVIIT